MLRPDEIWMDRFGKVVGDIAGIASAASGEAQVLINQVVERVLRDLDVVRREEFEALRESLQSAMEEIASLRGEIDAKKSDPNAEST